MTENGDLSHAGDAGALGDGSGLGGAEMGESTDGKGHANGRWSCSGCDNRWDSLSWQHCSAHGCHQTFTSTSTGDAHRTADFRCLAPADIGLEQNDRGAWHGVLTPERRAVLDKLAAKRYAKANPRFHFGGGPCHGDEEDCSGWSHVDTPSPDVTP